MTACFVFLWLNETRLSLPHISVTVRSWERREAEVFLWSWISVEAWSFGLNENEELRKVSSVRENSKLVKVAYQNHFKPTIIRE